MINADDKEVGVGNSVLWGGGSQCQRRSVPAHGDKQTIKSLQEKYVAGTSTLWKWKWTMLWWSRIPSLPSHTTSKRITKMRVFFLSHSLPPPPPPIHSVPSQNNGDSFSSHSCCSSFNYVPVITHGCC
jgi:hypothetical protein